MDLIKNKQYDNFSYILRSASSECFIQFRWGV